MVHDQGRQFGPHTEQEIAVLVGVGTVSEAALVWREGSSRWIPVSAVIPMPVRPVQYASMRSVPHPSVAAIRTGLLVSGISNIVVVEF
jgi:hypothetical protein